MLDRIPILSVGSALARHAEARTAVTARNLANADTPGWRALRVASFEDDGGLGMRGTRPGHAVAGALPPVTTTLAATSPNGNGVTVEHEMVEAARARADHDMALGAWKGALDIIRTSIGRGR